jgi:hypothetical protein
MRKVINVIAYFYIIGLISLAIVEGFDTLQWVLIAYLTLMCLVIIVINQSFKSKK